MWELENLMTKIRALDFIHISVSEIWHRVSVNFILKIRSGNLLLLCVFNFRWNIHPTSVTA